MTEKKMKQLLEANIIAAKQNKAVYKPLAWALYHTWKELDSLEKPRARQYLYEDEDGKNCGDCKYLHTLMEDEPCCSCVRMIREDKFTEVRKR